MTTGPLALLALGFVLGMRHATDADHLVAVAAFAHRERSARAAMGIGALWGVGHSVTVLIVGGAIVLGGLVVPPRLGLSLEMAVALMLILLGAVNLRAGAAASSGPPPAARTGWRPLAIGVVHGLAGSAAIALLMLTTIRDRLWAFFYLALFGAGTVAGMILMTAAMSVPLALASRRAGALERRVARLTGTLSLGFGLVLAYRLGIGGGLFTGAPHWTPR